MLSISQRLYYNDGMADARIVIPAGQTSVSTAIPVPRTGLLHRLIVKQNAGPSVGATVDLLVHSASGTGAPPVDIVKVVQSQTLTAGNAVFYSSDAGTPFRALVATSTNSQQYYLYLKITISAQGSATYWDAAIVWRTVDLY